MFKLSISLMMIMFSSMMIFFSHPLSMGMMILLQTLLLSILSGMVMKTYWFSYILMLTFLGGLLVLFIYVSSISSNEMFKFNMNMKKIIFIFFLLLFMFLILNFNNMNKMNLFFNNEMINFMNVNFFNNENKMNISKLYNNQTYLIMLIMIIYLFITLLTIVKITNIFKGTLRANLNYDK